MSEDTKKRELNTNIRISRSTRDILEKLGVKGETYDDVIRKLLKEAGKIK